MNNLLYLLRRWVNSDSDEAATALRFTAFSVMPFVITTVGIMAVSVAMKT